MNFLTDVCKYCLCMFWSLSSRSYIYIPHLEFVLTQSERSQVWAFSLYGDSVFPVPFTEEAFIVHFWQPFFKESSGYRCVGLFLLFLFHWSVCLALCQNYIVLVVNGCVICPEIMYCGFSMFVLFLQIALLICVLLCFLVNFRIVFLVLWRK